MMMIVTRLKGGLGNQLFQFAVAYAMAKKNKMRLALEISSYDHKKSRSLDIEKILNVSGTHDPMISLVKQTRFDRLVNKVNKRWQIIPQYFFLNARPYRYLAEPHFHFSDLNIAVDSRSIILDGYWQSFRYFDGVTDDLISVFDLGKPISAQAKDSAALLQNGQGQSCSIHIRRGDYTDPEFAGVYELLGMDYYNAAMDKMRAVYPSVQFYVFSDSPKLAKSLFETFSDCHFLPSESAMDDFYLMSQCRHNIIGNSTFSWWAAWFNQSSGRQVIAPSRWFANQAAKANDIRDLYPPEWTVL